MEVHGIDEAGYGPLLGPLVLARTDFVLEGREIGWTRVREPSVRVADSKQLLTGPGGRARLEAAVLGFSAALFGSAPATLDEWLARGGEDVARRTLPEHPWYRRLDLALPVWCAPEDVAAAADEVVRGRVCRGGRFAGLRLRVLSETELNRSVAATDNKHLSLFCEVADLVEEALSRAPAHRVLVDKLGGRDFYREKLEEAFPFLVVDTLEETRERSTYRLEPDDTELTISFLMKGDDREFAIALASMCAKYTREVLMGVFNDYWAGRVPGIKGTAGYYEDGRRFLHDLRRGGLSAAALAPLRRQR